MDKRELKIKYNKIIDRVNNGLNYIEEVGKTDIKKAEVWIPKIEEFIKRSFTIEKQLEQKGIKMTSEQRLNGFIEVRGK